MFRVFEFIQNFNQKSFKILYWSWWKKYSDQRNIIKLLLLSCHLFHITITFIRLVPRNILYLGSIRNRFLWHWSKDLTSDPSIYLYYRTKIKQTASSMGNCSPHLPTFTFKNKMPPEQSEATTTSCNTDHNKRSRETGTNGVEFGVLAHCKPQEIWILDSITRTHIAHSNKTPRAFKNNGRAVELYEKYCCMASPQRVSQSELKKQLGDKGETWTEGRRL